MCGDGAASHVHVLDLHRRFTATNPTPSPEVKVRSLSNQNESTYLRRHTGPNTVFSFFNYELAMNSTASIPAHKRPYIPASQ
jgi:hypothetical protein